MDNVVLRWNSVALQGVRVTHPGPPIVARALAVSLHTCIFDAWAAYMSTRWAPGSVPFCGARSASEPRTTRREPSATPPSGCYKDLFPTEAASVDALMTTLGFDPSASSNDPASPVGVGQLAAKGVLDFRHGDGSNQLGDLHPGAYSDYTNYVAVNTPDEIHDPNRWQPLRVPDGHGGSVVQSFIAPHWGLVTPLR